jgi:hypothetical protein
LWWFRARRWPVALCPHPEALNLAALDWLANELLAFRAPNEINVQMPFLRDLFVCLVAAPLLVRARTPVLGASR